MKRKMYQRVLCFVLSALTLFGTLVIPSFAAENSEYKTNAGSAATLEEMVALLGTSSYAAYSAQYDKKDYEGKGLETIEIPLLNFVGDGLRDALDPKSRR